MKALRDALSFLTIIKFQSPDFDAVKAQNAFAYAGVFIGCVLATISILFNGSFVEPIFILIAWVALTGALHMDVLMDTADALFSHRHRERKLEIMKDSRSGAMAVVVAVLLLIAKFEAISQLTNPLVYIIVPAFARYGLVWSMKTMPYIRSEGTGKMFFGDDDSSWFLQIIPVAIVCLFLGFKAALVVTVCFAVAVLVLQKWYKSQLGGITGDLLGAQCELTETAMLLVLAGVL